MGEATKAARVTYLRAQLADIAVSNAKRREFLANGPKKALTPYNKRMVATQIANAEAAAKVVSVELEYLTGEAV